MQDEKRGEYRMSKSIQEMWAAYLDSLGETPENTNKTFEAWHFCNNEKDANELADLAKKGVKKATTGLLKSYQIESDPLPIPGDYHIVTYWDKSAACIIQVLEVEILPFRDVTPRHAAIEGEGDGSLQYWREGHLKFYNEEAKEYNFEFTEDLEVVFMIFEVVYQ